MNEEEFAALEAEVSELWAAYEAVKERYDRASSALVRARCGAHIREEWARGKGLEGGYRRQIVCTLVKGHEGEHNNMKAGA